MTERDAVTAFVERVVAEARIPGSRARDDLRRELLAHFDDAIRRHGSVETAIAGFGPGADVASRLRGVYRTQRLAVHAARVAVGLCASLVAALGIELAASRPGAFRGMAGLACLIVLTLVVGRELVGRRLPRSAAAAAGRWAVGFLTLAGWEYWIHHHAGIAFGVLSAATAGAVLLAVAAATALIMAGADRAFGALLEPRGA